MGHISKADLLEFLTLCLGLFLSFNLFPTRALASPIAGTESVHVHHLIKRYQGTPAPKGDTGDGPAETDYPSDADIAAAFVAPKGAFVFFSGIQDSQ